MDYREETSWAIRIEAAATFGEHYDGDDDGYAWRDAFVREIQPAIAAAVYRQLSALPGWTVRPGNRGLPATDELMIVLERRFDATAES